MLMPMRKCFLYWIFIGLIFPAAASAQLQKIYLQPKSTTIEKQSQIVDSLRFIPLEIREDISLTDFNYVIITKAYFLIVNYAERNFLVYRRNGSFVKEVSFKKLGQGFYPSYQQGSNRLVFFGNNINYSLTKKDRVQIVQDWDDARNEKYFKKYSIDLADTTFAIKKEQPAKSDILGSNPYVDDLYYSGRINSSDLYKDSLDYELKIYKSDKLVKGYFPYNRINEPKYLYAEESVFLTGTNEEGKFFVTRPYCDTIYKMSKDSITPAWQLVLPMENTPPPYFYTQPFKNKTERENFRRNNGWVLNQVVGFYENPRLIIFGVRYLSNYESYLYLKQNKVTYKSKNIRPDTTQFNLSLLSDNNVQRQGNRFYKTLKAGDLITFFEKYKTVAVPKELQAFLNSKPKSTSPVIVEFQLKN
jgi:hypothetical protein